MIAVFYLLVGAGAIVFQTAVAEYFLAWTGARPDAMLLAASFLGLHRGREAGLVGGFLLGLLQDTLSGGLLGANALSKGLIGHATGGLRRNVTGREALFHGAIGLLASVFHTVLSAGLAAFFLPNFPLPADFWLEGAKTAALNTLLAPVIIGVLGAAEARILPYAGGTPYPERS